MPLTRGYAAGGGGGGGGVPPSRTLTAGAGLTGGGDLSADRTFDVVANVDGSIVVNANDIQVGVLASDAQHGARGGGTQHAVATGAVAGFMSATDKTKLDSYPATPTGLSLDHGVNLTAPSLLDDDHTQYLLLSGVGRGGQTAYGGVVAGNILELEGANAAPDTGRVHINSPVEFFYDTASNTTPAESYLMRWRPVGSIGAYVGGFLRADYDLTTTSTTYIPGIFVDGGTTRVNAAPGFWAYTFINVIHVIRNVGNFDFGSALVLNVGLVMARETAGTTTSVNGTAGINFAPQTRATVSGAVMTTNQLRAVTVAPTFSSVTGSTVNMGTITGVRCVAPVVALAQPQTGVETVTAYYGLHFTNIVFPTSGNKAAVFNEMSDAVDRFCILNTGGARSDFGGGNLLDCGVVQILADNLALSLGAAGGDVQINWNGSALEFDPLVGDDLRFSFASGSHTIDTASASATAEILFGHPKGAFGQTSSVGNQKYIFVANAETITIAGEYSQFLLTQAANDTINAALSLYAGWTINAPGPTIGTGSLTTGVALNVGGNPTGTVNRVGVRIISNPSGGSGVNAALWVTAGATVLDGVLQHGGSTLGFYGATPVAQSAAYTPTNVTTDRAYDANATTVNELADVLGTLIADLQATGIIG